MSSSKSKGPILRASGGGPVRLITTRQDWETRAIGEKGTPSYGLAVGMSLLSFEAKSYREWPSAPGEPPTDLWEFVVNDGAERFHVYLSGDEIFMLYIQSSLVGS